MLGTCKYFEILIIDIKRKMDSKVSTDNQDSAITSTQLSLASVSVNSESNNEYVNMHDYWNVVNSRFIYYSSKALSSSLSFQPKDDYKTEGAREVDYYMNTLLDRYIQQKLVNCAINSDSASAALNKSFVLFNKKQRSRSSNNIKTDDGLVELTKLKLLHYEMNSREEQNFHDSLDECDEWRELEEEFRGRSDEAMKAFAESPQSDCKLHDAVKKDNMRTKQIEEVNKSLLIGVNVDYVEDEESRKIMFKENL